MHSINLVVHENFPRSLRKALSEDLVEQVVTLNGADYYVNAFDATTETFCLTPTDDRGIPLPAAATVKLPFDKVEDVQIY